MIQVTAQSRAASEPSITRVEDLLTFMRGLGGTQVRSYYRGESRTEDDYGMRRLLPALLRGDTLQRLRKVHNTQNAVRIQRVLLSRLHRYVPMGGASKYATLPRGGFSGDSLCVAQHHGLPTLLLDWTLSPLAALYFAVLRNDKHDGRVWYMALKPVNSRRKYTVHLEEGEKLEERTPVPVLVVPGPISRRIEVQVGRFIYFGRYSRPLEEYHKEKNSDLAPFTRIGSWKVEASQKLRIRQELAKLQIHGGTMFPGIDGYARYLAEGGL
jgi:hypothetical protein